MNDNPHFYDDITNGSFQVPFELEVKLARQYLNDYYSPPDSTMRKAVLLVAEHLSVSTNQAEQFVESWRQSFVHTYTDWAKKTGHQLNEEKVYQQSIFSVHISAERTEKGLVVPSLDETGRFYFKWV